jgi:RNA polymerase sigma factor (sigma-70 family)
MEELKVSSATGSDESLVNLARAGDKGAFAELWRRHARSGIRVASQLTSAIDADDLVAEAYVRIYQRVLAGGGPQGAFRPYLYTTIRNLACTWGRSRRDVNVRDMAEIEDPVVVDDFAAVALDRSLTARAFRSLPERWQSVLWYTEIEGMDPHEVAPILGLSANGVAALSYRAREGLRTAWLQAHVSDVSASGECRWAIGRLGEYARHGLTSRERARLSNHLSGCTKCSIISEEVDEVGSRLALVILPLVLGGSAGGAFLASLSAPATATAASAMTTAAATASTATTSVSASAATTSVAASAATASSATTVAAATTASAATAATASVGTAAAASTAATASAAVATAAASTTAVTATAGLGASAISAPVMSSLAVALVVSGGAAVTSNDAPVPAPAATSVSQQDLSGPTPSPLPTAVDPSAIPGDLLASAKPTSSDAPVVTGTDGAIGTAGGVDPGTAAPTGDANEPTAESFKVADGSGAGAAKEGTATEDATPAPPVPNSGAVSGSALEAPPAVPTEFNLAGTGTPGATVTLGRAGVAYGTTTVAPDGTWTLQASATPGGSEDTGAAQLKQSVSSPTEDGTAADGSSSRLTVQSSTGATDFTVVD